MEEALDLSFDRLLMMMMMMMDNETGLLEMKLEFILYVYITRYFPSLHLSLSHLYLLPSFMYHNNELTVLQLLQYLQQSCRPFIHDKINPLNAELNPICHLLALLGDHHILHVSRERVNTFAKSIK